MIGMTKNSGKWCNGFRRPKLSEETTINGQLEFVVLVIDMREEGCRVGHVGGCHPIAWGIKLGDKKNLG